MKRNPGLVFFVIVVSLMMFVFTGCGPETDQANQIVGEVNQLSVEDDLTQAAKLISDSIAETTKGQAEIANQDLSKASERIKAASGTLETARDKIDQAASLNISDQFHNYLEAKKTALDQSLEIAGILNQEIDIMVKDPGMEKPESSKQLADLEGKAEDLSKKISDAEQEASKLASESDEIK